MRYARSQRVGRPGWGFLYFFIYWTFLPALLGILWGISYLVMSDDEVEEKHREPRRP